MAYTKKTTKKKSTRKTTKNRRQMAKKGETAFKESLLKELKKIPDSFFYKNVAVSCRGIPDIIGCVKGFGIFLEVKTDCGQMDKLQQYTGIQIIKAGGFFRCIRPENYREIIGEIVRIVHGKILQ